MAIVTAAALAVAACAVDSDGVLRPGASDVVDPIAEGVEATPGACAELLRAVQDSALAVVGPNGLPDDDPFNQFNDFRGGLVIIDRAAFGWDDGSGEASTLPQGTADAVVLGDRVVVVRDGWLHVLAPDADAPVHSSWLGSVAVGEDPLLVAEDDGLLVIHETSASIGEQVGRAVRIARVTIGDDGQAVVEESVEVLGYLAGADLEGDVLQLAVRREAPALDLVQATTAGAEEIALEVNRAAIASTTIDDWVPLLRHQAGDDEAVDTLVGGCDVVTPPGSETALGTTALLQHEYGASLADVSGQLVLGEGVVAFEGDHAWLLSSRTSLVDFGGEGGAGGFGTERVVTVRLAAGEDGYEAEAAGIVAGRLQTPGGVAVGEDGILLFTSEDQWGNQMEVTSLGGTNQLTHLDARSLNLDWWGVFSTSTLDEDTVVLSRQGGTAIIDVSVPGDIQVETIETRWNQGFREAAPQLFPYGDDSFVASSGGQIVSDWGSVEIFFEQIVANEFGGQPRLEDWFGQPGSVSLDVREGGTEQQDMVAEWSGDAFGLWVVSADPDEGTVVVGVAGLRDPDEPPILGGELFTGAVTFDVVGDALVERERISFVPTQPDDIGASDCERATVDQFFLDVAGLWNSQLFTCDPGVGAGVVGYSCWGAEFGEIDPEMLRWNWGIEDTSEIEAELADLRAVTEAGGTVIACRAKAPITVDVPLRELPTDNGDLWVTTTTGVARLVSGVDEISVHSLEPPYGA
ncbi:MAG: hypothetical protein R8F63_11485 [Acidimicrobiales bacterium]|nr:hypothetical protein [Acidimicrobiales bacterium]